MSLFSELEEIVVYFDNIEGVSEPVEDWAATMQDWEVAAKV